VELSVRDNPAQERFEVYADGRLAGYARYQIQGRRITMFHTEVKPEFEGAGVGSALARGALDEVAKRKLDLLPTCPFIAGYIARHQDEYLSLVPEALRQRVIARG
jgi:predicted GNAT family acetyltransferase